MWRARLAHQAHGALAKCRMGELFDMIVDFPDSEPAFRDLKDWFVVVLFQFSCPI